MSDVIDLDALAPAVVTVKLGGQEIEIKPPSTGDILRLASLGKKMESVDTQDPEQLEATISGLVEQVKKCIPAIAEHNLSTSQLLRLVKIINEMAVPPDAKELEERGITPDGPKAQ